MASRILLEVPKRAFRRQSPSLCTGGLEKLTNPAVELSVLAEEVSAILYR